MNPIDPNASKDAGSFVPSAAETVAGDSAGASPGGGRRHRSAEKRRHQILAAALSCFGEKGYHAATMDDLVRASGLSKGSLYWHFGSKEEVFLALCDSFAAEFNAALDEAVRSGADPMEVLRREAESAIKALAGNRLDVAAWMEFLSHPVARERFAAIYATTRLRFARIIERGRASGSLRAGPPADRVAGALIGAGEGLVLQWLVDPEFDLQSHFDASWEILTGGLCA